MAIEQYETQKGQRPDLEALETNPVIGYIGSRIFPPVNTMEKTGTIYYRTLSADVAAQTGRSTGVAPTRTLLTDSSTTFTCAEVVKRYGVDRDEVKQMGGIASADKLGGTASKRSVQRAIEAAVALAILKNSGATTYDIEASLIAAVGVGKEAIRRYPGKTALVLSSTIFDRIMSYSEITARFNLASASILGVQAEDIISRKPSALKLALGGILGIDEILIGDDDQWYDQDAAMQDRAALVKLPDPEAFSHKLDPMLGKQMLYLPDGSQPFMVESFYDPDIKVNNYDAAAWYQLKILNTGAIYVLDGIDASNTVTTSAATTTTTTGA